jgi:DHA1 family bicyclomycin/chloramphenicol resistance-like MFS transporter
LKQKFLTLFLVLLSAFPPLSVDLYLPALPTISAFYGVPEYQTNLTLTVFFVVLALSTLLCGPLSDKYGRKPVLFVGMCCYLAGSLLCCIAGSIEQLILFRVLQAIGGGCGSSTASAIVKDLYPKNKQGRILAVIQAMVVVCPAVAPSLGALMLNFATWRGLFLIQAGIGIAALTGTLLVKETLAEPNDISVLRTFGRLWILQKNGNFAALVIAFSLPGLAGMCYVAISPYIYQDFFGLSAQAFGFYYAFIAFGMIAGSLLYIGISRFFSSTSLVVLCFTIFALCGASMFLFGKMSPWILTLTMMLASLCFCVVKPLGVIEMLNLHKNDNGTASSLIGGCGMFAGSIGTFFISLFHDYIVVIGAVHAIGGVLSILLWLYAAQKNKKEKL